MKRLKGFRIKTLTPVGEQALRIHLNEEGRLSWTKRKILRRFFSKEPHEDGVTYRFSTILEASMNLNDTMRLQSKEYAQKMASALEENGAAKKDYTITEVWE